ncbi:MAG: nucleotidyltransferase [Clostridia bacterium]|nr:nucleotidyltransferase [Clostridia bacterium]
MDVTLVVMAAGMGARFGGLKQLTPIGQSGETVAEFSVYDALRAGFSRAVFVIKPEMERDFRERVLARFERHIRCDLVFQRMDDLPQGAPALPTERGQKPLGTAHAVWSCRNTVREPFLVINADDFYGASAFRQVRAFLLSYPDTGTPHPYCMAAYRLKDTVSEHGSVSRGVCEIDGQGNLRLVVERTRIQRAKGQEASFYAQEGERTIPLGGDMPVSLNAWGFHPSVFTALEEALQAFLSQPTEALIKGECYLPSVVESMLESNRAYVRALPARDRWIGITYAEDLEPARRLIRNLTDEGKYPADLWAQEIHRMGDGSL